MAKKQLSYNEAMEQLEKILVEIENNALDIDKLSEKMSTAAQLISLCKEKLYKTEKEVQKIISEVEVQSQHSAEEK
ncbi:MAG: exodeoxyribonuclease VII small subunit [Candidatus Azobacteroides sp.]|nr:exodeoxyribonuclease VII small subunit [Candidatus Azobacteroides sp.]